ncbi:MAG: hypothetical protein LLG42_03395 [Chloroflexi bacterium]|nr:hypothetical protein [Chloroflexota bacterium]
MKKNIILILALLSIAYFVVFCFPNSANSDNINMVQVFEPDEAMPLPYVFHMIEPYGSLKLSLYNFAYYNYYFYGFPHFALSAILLLPLKWAGQLDNIPLVMAVLRQAVSLLPILAAIWLLVYLQTGFKTWKAVPLFLLLAGLPAVVENNFWWHPDGLAILLMMLAILFLARDNLRFGRYFYLSAALCGLAAMTKGIGFYFFLSVFVYLVLGWVNKKASPGRLVLSAAGYLAVMAAAYFISNPILVYSAERERFFEIMRDQSELLTQGYELQYAKGLAAALPTLKEYYGSWPFLLAGLAACVGGIRRGPDRLLQIIILAWVIPLSVMDFFIIHFKFQYWLPAALPLFSTFALILPERIDFQNLCSRPRGKPFWESLFRVGLGAILLIQFIFFVASDGTRFVDQLHKSENSSSIAFYDEASGALSALPKDAYRVYHDVRMYVPQSSGWVTETNFEVLTYRYIEKGKFDILLIMQSRVSDYLNPDAQAVDEEELAQAREFYGDVRAGTVEGYRLVYQNGYGLIFVRDALYEQYFASENSNLEELWPACRSCQPN